LLAGLRGRALFPRGRVRRDDCLPPAVDGDLPRYRGRGVDLRRQEAWPPRPPRPWTRGFGNRPAWKVRPRRNSGDPRGRRDGGRRKGQDLRHPQRACRRHRREAGGLLRGPWTRGSGAPGSGIGPPAALTVWPSVLMPQGCTEKDFTQSNVAWLLWGVPAAVLILGSLVSPLPRMLLWTPAFAVAGVACVVNAAHCGRVHCYVTGPLYLLAAIATLLAGMEFVPLRSS